MTRTPFPKFHEKRISPSVRTARLVSASEHPEKHLHIDDFAAVLKEPFSTLHDTAANALLKIHDANTKNTRAIDALETHFNQLRTTERPLLPLQKFLDRLHGELNIRGKKVLKSEIGNPNPLRPIALAMLERKTKKPDRKTIDTAHIRRVLTSREHTNGLTYGRLVSMTTNPKTRLQHCLLAFGGRRSRLESNGELTVPHEEYERTLNELKKAGIKIDHVYSPNKRDYHLRVTPSEEFMNFIKTYKH